MRIYVSHSSGYDYESELYAPLRDGFAAEHDIVFPHDGQSDGFDAKEIIRRSDMVIADVSFPSTGQGIELGWADEAGVAIVCIARRASVVSSALRFVASEVTEYDNASDIINQLRVRLSRQQP